MIRRLWIVVSVLWAAMICGMLAITGNELAWGHVVLGAGPFAIGLAVPRVARYVIHGQ